MQRHPMYSALSLSKVWWDRVVSLVERPHFTSVAVESLAGQRTSSVSEVTTFYFGRCQKSGSGGN